MVSVNKLLSGILYALILKFLLVNLVSSAPASNETNSNGTRWLVCVGFCPEIKLRPRCFSADSLVSLIDGQQQYIGQLRSGDNVLGFDGMNIVSSEMILMLDRNMYTEAIFYTLETESNHMISLTGEHLIPVVSDDGMPKYIPAMYVKAGYDALYVLSKNQTLIQSPVIKVSVETKVGYLAPYTTTSTLIVNNIVASCLSHINSQEMGHIAMVPLRWYYTLSRYFPFIDTFDDGKSLPNQDGVHWIPQAMLNLVQRFYPSMLHFS